MLSPPTPTHPEPKTGSARGAAWQEAPTTGGGEGGAWAWSTSECGRPALASSSPSPGAGATRGAARAAAGCRAAGGKLGGGPFSKAGLGEAGVKSCCPVFSVIFIGFNIKCFVVFAFVKCRYLNLDSVNLFIFEFCDFSVSPSVSLLLCQFLNIMFSQH